MCTDHLRRTLQWSVMQSCNDVSREAHVWCMGLTTFEHLHEFLQPMGALSGSAVTIQEAMRFTLYTQKHQYFWGPSMSSEEPTSSVLETSYAIYILILPADFEIWIM